MWIILDYRRVVEVTGQDRHSFLQGLITQDVSKATPENPLYGLFLTPTGRFFCDFFIVATENSFLLTPGTTMMESFIKKLSFYKLRSDVGLSVLPDWGVAVSLANDFSKVGHVFKDPRSNQLGSLFIGPLDQLNPITFDRTPYEKHRLRLGIPEGPLDLEAEKSIPLENQMDEMGAIDWDKGCFLGQELTARTKYVGEVRKRLLPFTAEAPCEPQTSLTTEEGEVVGRVISVYEKGKRGFALVRTDPFINTLYVLGTNIVLRF
ncbi:MAG: YgfZ/GcvT domain-containing protein [Alphaproteobacteria bacterium]